MKKSLLSIFAFGALITGLSEAHAQTNVFDNVIATSPNHTLLEAALVQEGLQTALQDPTASLTVFAPDDNAFNALATALNINIDGLLALPNLNDILLYHVLGVEVPASGVTNGAIVDPLSPTNSLKLTVNGSNVFVNQAQVNAPDLFADNGVVHSTNAVLLPYTTVADIAIGSPDHTTLVAAVIEARLLPALTDPLASLTVFAPTDAAFTAALNALNLTAAELLASPDLSDILLYHVLGEEVLSTDLSNGMLANPLNTTNTLKVTLDVSGVFVNQAQVTIPDLPADNGTVHVLDAVVLPSTTVADVAIGSPAHTTLVAAVIEARLLPALTNPFSSLNVFAPTDAAFTAALNELGLTAAQLLASASLSDILLYHVLGAEVLSTDLSNGMLATPLNSANTLKVTIDGSNVFVNQAQVTAANLPADNGTVHVLDGVVLPNTTVVDVALGSTAHTTLVTALIQEHLLPVLTDPYSQFTVFAPTNTAFNNLATALGTDLNGILALPNLTDVLTYHVVGQQVLSTQLVEGPVATVNGTNIFIFLDGSVVVVNDANVTAADLASDNGVVHVLDKVLLPSFASIEDNGTLNVSVYPNPAVNELMIDGASDVVYTLVDMTGRKVAGGQLMNGKITIENINSGTYMLNLQTESGMQTLQVVKQ
ncbi:MAG: fasciclin domain-containing protein [Bacteroidota bacterium]